MPFQSCLLPTQIWDLFLQTPGRRTPDIIMVTVRKTQAEEGRFWHTRHKQNSSHPQHVPNCPVQHHTPLLETLLSKLKAVPLWNYSLYYLTIACRSFLIKMLLKPLDIKSNSYFYRWADTDRIIKTANTFFFSVPCMEGKCGLWEGETFHGEHFWQV